METLTELIKRKLIGFIDFIRNCITKYSDEFNVNYSLDFFMCVKYQSKNFYSTNNYGEGYFKKTPWLFNIWHFYL